MIEWEEREGVKKREIGDEIMSWRGGWEGIKKWEETVYEKRGSGLWKESAAEVGE